MVRFKDKKIVTSALPYIHGIPHLGNITGSLLPADIYKRFLDVVGVENISICGSDEHGTPLELAAIEAGKEPKNYADEQHKRVKEVIKGFNIDFTLYGRTHTEYNKKQTHRMFKKLYKNGYIAEKVQEMPYCTDCQRFLPDRYIEGECPHCGGLARGDQCDEQGCGKLLEPEELVKPYCTVCNGRDIEFKETKNLYLQLPKFEEKLRKWIKEEKPVPKNVEKEVLNLIEDGLEDRCITRDISWGFDVPTEGLDGLDDEVYKNKVLYVWFDAPIGYIGITRQLFDQKGDEDLWESYWRNGDAETVYNIGKDNTIFHTIIWPAVLLGQEEDYNLPDYEFIYQFLLSEDVQFSKSRGVGLDGKTALEMLPADYWRFYLASVMPIGHDSKFSLKDFEKRINNELNDTVGNYVNRVLSLAEKWFGNKVPELNVSDLEEDSKNFLYSDKGVKKTVEEYYSAIEQEKNIRKGLKKAVEIARKGDEFLSRKEPWKNEEVKEDVIFSCLQSINVLASALYPYLPDASESIWSMLNIDKPLETGRNVLEEFKEETGLLKPGHKLGKKKILFEKVDSKQLKSELDDKKSEEDEKEGEKMSEKISFEQFQKLDLRVGTIKKVEEHPNADRLYLLQIDVGEGEIKQSCSSIKDQFSPEELEGRQVVVLTNLEPAKMRGEVSEAMILAAEDSDGEVTLVEPGKKIENGVKVV